MLNRCPDRARIFVFILLFGSLAASPAPAQQVTPDAQAVQLLDAARRAYNERNLPFAADRFREFLQKYGGHKDVNYARLGLGLALLESPQPQYQPAIDQLRPAADAAEFPERGLASFYLGTAYRALGHAALVQAAQKPAEAPTHRNTANQQFDQAIKCFEIAATSFAAKLKPPYPAADPLPSDYEWATRSRLDHIEMQLRLLRGKEALTAVEKLLADPDIKRSKYLKLAQYYLGYSQYTAGEWLAAAKTLSQLGPFDDPSYGPHARYMLGRSHHLLGDQKAAALHYEAIIAAYDDELSKAKQVAANAELLKNDQAERARLLLVFQSPAPDYVARSWFYAGVMAYEQEKFSDALDRFTKFAERYKLSPLMNEALLRKGMVQVRLKQNQEALASLTPIQDDAALTDQVRWWMGRAFVGLAGANPAALKANLDSATAQLKTASDRAGQKAAQDSAAKLRKQDILLELGDAYQQNKQFNEAVTTFQQVLNEQPDAERAELALQRLTTALHLAAKYPESDQACMKFIATYPKSTLLPAVLFRHEENALAVAEAQFKTPNLANREAALKTAYTEVAARAKKLVATYPESPEVNLALHALGLAQYRMGDIEGAAKTLAQIPPADRGGDLTTVNYLLGDCLLRLAPENADDALAAGKMLEEVGEVVKLLDSFIAANPVSPSLPDALVKLGDAQLRIASVIENEQERNQTLQLARQAYEKVINGFAQNPAAPVAVYERARCMIAQKDVGGAMNEYRRFLADPLKASPVAPMAVLRLATMLRIDKKPQDAVEPLNQTRQQHEAALIADPARAAWAPMLQYHHALCLKEANKLPEAQAMFENLAQRFPKSPEALDSAWRVQQCRREILLAKLEPARATLARIDAPANEVAAAKTVVQETMTQLAQIAALLEQQAAALEATAKGSEPQLSGLHEAAWCYRLLAQNEISVAREKLREEGLKKRQDEINRTTPSGRAPAKAAAPDVPLTAIPLTPSEKKARDMYAAMIKKGADARLAPVAKLQLAEVHAFREEFDKAAELLTDALSDEVPEDLADRLHVRLAACLVAQGDGDSAYGEVEPIAKNDKHPLWPEAKFLVGEALIAQKKYAPAVEHLKMFRDHGPLQNIPGVSDRAMMRLGYAYEQLAQFEPARQAYETHWGRYPQSPWRVESRYAQAWCQQKLNQHDAAVNTYSEVTKLTTSEVAARAQYNIGVCRFAQQRWQEAADAYQLCAYTYDYPELSSQGLVEAAIAMETLKKVPDAAKLLTQVSRDYPKSKAAVVAAERLQKLPVMQ
jgi:TolA-binding protein